MLKTRLLIIDPQNDFCDPNGSLFIPGADEDCVRLSAFIDRLKEKLHDIHVTLDSHHYVDIAHPVFWMNSEGKHPDPFTTIEEADVKNGLWKTTNPQFQCRAEAYVSSLAANQRYALCIWPPHCLIGTKGHNVVVRVSNSLGEWEKSQFAMVDYVTKGSNFWTEHYSAVQADVPDPDDPGTMLNTRLIEALEDSEMIIISGQASSHCVANTVTDIANNFGEENVKKFIYMDDLSSPVPGFEQLEEDFLKQMTGRGMQRATSNDFMTKVAV